MIGDKEILIPLLLVLVGTLSICSLQVDGYIVEDCSSNPLGKLQNVSLSGCDFYKDEFCKLIRNTDATIKVDFVPNSALDKANIAVGAKIGAMFLPFPLKPDDACAHWGLKCPMPAGSSQQLSLSLPIKPIYPSMPNMKVQLKLLSDQKDVICILFPAKIVDK